MIILLALGTFLLALFDTALVAFFVVNIIKMLFGENPLSRLLRLLGGVVSFGLYGYWVIYKTAEFWSSTEDISAWGMIIPLALPLVLIAVFYIMNGSGNDNNNNQM